MVLVITDDDIRGLVSMDEYVQAMETAYAEYGAGVAAIRPRQRYQVTTRSDYAHQTNIIGGAVPSCGLSAIRLNSWPRPGPTGKRHPQASNVGLIVLFDLETGDLVAILTDGVVSDLRVGATTAVALRRLARENAHAIGVLGSGRQARSNLEAICRVREITHARVYSPTRDHREAFAAQMAKRLDIAITPVESSAACVTDVDIIGCFTSSDAPVFDGNLIRPGQTIVSIRNTDHVGRYDEVDRATFLKADLIAISDRPTLIDNRQSELLELMESGAIPSERVVELGDLVAGKVAGRTDDQQVVYYKNNTGMGIQFAAPGRLVLDAARARGLGTHLPDSLFMRAR